MPLMKISFRMLLLVFSLLVAANTQTFHDDSLVVVDILSANGLTTWPHYATKEGRISELDFHDMGLRMLPPSVGSLSKLERLQANDDSLYELPSSFSNLQNLKSVYFIRNRFTQWPEIFRSMPNLEVIDLGGNHITDLPLKIYFKAGIKELYLNDNYLTKLPINIGDYPIELIHTAGNGLCNVSDEIIAWLDLHDYYKENSKWRTYQYCNNYNIDSLKVLDILKKNGWTGVPVDSIVTIVDGKIMGIDLSYDRLAHFMPSGNIAREIMFPDDELVYIRQLRSLNLSGQNLDTLPYWFNLMCHLKKLDLSNNNFTTLPDFMAAFRNLTSLDLSGNKINAPSVKIELWANTFAPGWRGKQIGTLANSGQFEKQVNGPRITIARFSNHSTNIQVRFAKSLQAEVALYSVSGKQTTLAKKRFEPGVYAFNFNYSRLPPGTYLVTLKSEISVLEALKIVKY